MAALVASFSRPAEQRTGTERSQKPPADAGAGPEAIPGTASPSPAHNPPQALSFEAGSRDRRRLAQGRAATLEITVDEPGTVDVPDMGLTASADEHTPARFEVFPARAGAYAILFRPANSDRSRPAGTLVVTTSG
jgi:hypothetical protein